ncbi:sodium:sulfate symporter [Wenxinia marina]|uniref:Di-and tricarboxylate transporter n=1 Tax=Wenxinia marina DSM 24838 TaxID=1123501 RepID=A0A0D0QA65_9RHOB|nr:SLC13 family permease [Wenxinia marina]KIQ71359.1 Di- and tricarboxylate transporter [Wenxinia marina DSM 24838]GGL81334.1 sodium:sulfate symporter [Wenxinia marina]
MSIIPEPWQAEVALLLIVLLLAAFMSERYPADVTAAGGAALFILLGLVPVDDVMQAFANPAPITIAALFVISGALVRTGLLEAMAGYLVDRASVTPRAALVTFFLGALVASAFVNNTPVVLILIPVITRLARALDTAETRLLIPLSYVAIVGGTCTLIGTSTNILVAGVAQEQGLERFGIFEITGVGLMVAAAGLVSLMVLGPLLLPGRAGSRVGATADLGYLTEVRIGAEYGGIGRPLAEVSDFRRAGVRVTGLRTGSGIVRRKLDERVLEAGDVLILRADLSELLTLHETEHLVVGLRRGGRTPEGEPMIAEAIVTPALGRRHDTLSDLEIASRYGMIVLGAHRHGHPAGPDLAAARLRPADKLLLEGPASAFERLSQRGELVSVTVSAGRAYRRAKAPVAVLALVGIVALAAFGVAPIEILSLIAVAAILILRCIDNDEAWSAIDGGILVLIFSMLIIGRGMENSGAVQLIADAAAPWLEPLPAIAMLAAVYLMTSILTETVTNNAVAVVVTPVAIALAEGAGLDPRGFVVAVMMGASASFATPVGYQTNTLVYGAGDYRFTDFLKIGVPMNLIAGAAAVLAIPVFFPLGG